MVSLSLFVGKLVQFAVTLDESGDTAWIPSGLSYLFSAIIARSECTSQTEHDYVIERLASVTVIRHRTFLKWTITIKVSDVRNPG